MKYSIKSIEILLKSYETLQSDKEWNLILPLQLRIHPDRDATLQQRIRTDFGMTEGQDELTTSVRCAFMRIIEKEWFIDVRSAEEKKASTNQRFYKFELINSNSIELNRIRFKLHHIRNNFSSNSI